MSFLHIATCPGSKGEEFQLASAHSWRYAFSQALSSLAIAPGEHFRKEKGGEGRRWSFRGGGFETGSEGHSSYLDSQSIPKFIT